MKNDGVPIASEGVPFLALGAAATLAAFLMSQLWLAVPLLGLTLFTAYFFRNPERTIPSASRMLVSPADGKVISVGECEEKEFQKQPMLRISIFMSLFDVHVNRIPIDGKVTGIRYHPGRFLAAYEEDASELNERNALEIETLEGERITLVQVAGLVARRIVCYPKEGELVMKGQRMGLIRFGSRCDVYLPRHSDIQVKVGDKVFGGESILAFLREKA